MEPLEYTGNLSASVTHEEGRGTTLRFLRDGEVVAEIHLTREGATRLGRELIRRT